MPLRVSREDPSSERRERKGRDIDLCGSSRASAGLGTPCNCPESWERKRKAKVFLGVVCCDRMHWCLEGAVRDVCSAGARVARPRKTWTPSLNPHISTKDLVFQELGIEDQLQKLAGDHASPCGDNNSQHALLVFTHLTFTTDIVIITPFYSWGNWGTEKIDTWHEVIWLVNGEVTICTQVVWGQSLWSQPWCYPLPWYLPGQHSCLLSAIAPVLIPSGIWNAFREVAVYGAWNWKGHPRSCLSVFLQILQLLWRKLHSHREHVRLQENYDKRSPRGPLKLGSYLIAQAKASFLNQRMKQSTSLSSIVLTSLPFVWLHRHSHCLPK